MDTRTVLTLTLSGDVFDYTPAVKTALERTFANITGVLPEQVLVTIEAGSVVMGVQVVRTIAATAGEEIDPRQKRMLTRRKQELIFLLILL